MFVQWRTTKSPKYMDMVFGMTIQISSKMMLTKASTIFFDVDHTN